MKESFALLMGFFLVFFSVLSTEDLISSNSLEQVARSGWRYSVYDPFLEKIGYIDNKGDLVIEPRFNGVHQIEFRDLGWIEIDGKYGYIDGSGELVIPARFDAAGPFYEGMADVELNGKSGYINKKGELVFMLDFWGSEFSDGLAWVRLDKENWGFMDKSGDLVIGPVANEDIDPSIPLSYGLPSHRGGFSEGLLAIKKEEKFGYMDKRGKIVIEPSFDYCSDFHEGLAWVNNNESCGYIDRSGKIVIEPQFYWVNDFSEGVAAVGKKIGNSKELEFFLINKKGEILAGPKRGWEWVGEFSGAVAVVSVNSRSGLINQKFEFVIEPTFHSIGAFYGGIASASRDGLTGYIDRKGRWIWSRPTGRSLTFFFRDTTQAELIQTIQSCGHVTVKKGEREVPVWGDPSNKERLVSSPIWENRSNKGVLLYMRIEDLSLLADSVILGVDKKRQAFEAVLYANATTGPEDEAPRATAVLDVRINPCKEAEEALRDFAIFVLSAHPGVVGDEYHDHAWTLKEIKEDLTWNGIHFLRPHKRD